METDFDTFRQRLEAALGDKKLYGSWLAKQGVNKSTLNSAMTRRAIPGVEILVKIADECAVSVDFLLGRETGPAPAIAFNEQIIGEAIATLHALTVAVDHQSKLSAEERVLLDSFRHATPERREIALEILMRKVD